MSKWGHFFVGAAVGIVAYELIKTPAFKKVCASVVAKGMDLKNEAAAFAESVKEDAQDIAAEQKYKESKEK